MNDDFDWKGLAYDLAMRLLDEIIYSRTPTQATLNLLSECKEIFDDVEFNKIYDEAEVDNFTASE